MLDQIKPFGEPVKAIERLLGDSYSKEYSGLSDFCGLIRERQPRKIVKVGGANSSTTAAMLSCVDMLPYTCSVYIVDSMQETFPYAKDVFNLEKELKQCDKKTISLFKRHTLAWCMDKIGGGTDLLILDPAVVMPGIVLEFISALPYLTPDTMIVVCSSLLGKPNNNILLKNVVADKYSAHFEHLSGMWNSIEYITTDAISVLQINSKTSKYIVDLFATLRCPWSYIPRLDYLLEYDTFIRRHYTPMCLEIYEQAVLAADPYKVMLKNMTNSLLGTFSQILLYGKGRRGSYFLKLTKLLGIPVTGFVVSDGRNTEETYEDLPIYPCSQIPFPPNDVFIFKTAKTKEIDYRLRNSRFHWMNLPENFWIDCDYINIYE